MFLYYGGKAKGASLMKAAEVNDKVFGMCLLLAAIFIAVAVLSVFLIRKKTRILAGIVPKDLIS